MHPDLRGTIKARDHLGSIVRQRDHELHEADERIRLLEHRFRHKAQPSSYGMLCIECGLPVGDRVHE